MISRLLTLPSDENCFLFGARSTGKTTLLNHRLFHKNAVVINLLKADVERQFRQDPDALYGVVKTMGNDKTHIIIDEIQKVPKLLDVVHDLIENTSKNFILTGSSTRKLKHGGANLLAGRAFVYYLYPFNYFEVTDKFTLNDALHWGMLPKIFSYDCNEKKHHYLDAYTKTYLKEEIWDELIVRKIDPFRNFLEVAAQSNGKVINFSNIARDIGSTDNTVRDYFTILEDTLIGFFLNPFQHSFRKRLSKKPKFYFFDTGVVRTLCGLLSVPLIEQSSAYGEVFEHFIILQCQQLSNYYHLDYRFSYLATKDGAKIDLVVERPGKKILFIDIRSSKQVEARHVKTLTIVARDYGDCEAVCFSRDSFKKQIGEITVYPWREGLQYYFLNKKL